jgi:predicted dehydrogenase
MFNPRPDDPRYWLVRKQRSGGGPMMDFGCHRIEVLINILGPIESTTSVVRKVLFEREVEDTAIACFEFENRACGVLAVTHAAFESQDTLNIFGSRGSIDIPLLNRGEIRIKTPAGARVESHPPHQNIHQPLIEDFSRAVLDDRQPQVGGHVGREVARLEEEIYRKSEK